jgi:hypothetical protein
VEDIIIEAARYAITRGRNFSLATASRFSGFGITKFVRNSIAC